MSLEALERSDLSRLPGGIFTRAFVRAYAEEVGLDPDRTIQDFIAELPPEAATATSQHAAVEDGEKLESDRRAVATALRIVLVSLPIISLVLYFGVRGTPAVPPGEAPGAAPHTPAIEVPVAPQTPATAAGPPDAATPGPGAVPQTSGLSMEFSTRATCWVSVTTDGEQVFSAMMNPGQRRVATAKEQIALNVGDAGAFVYTLNGRAGKPLGAPGEVVSMRITLANLQIFLTP